MILIYQLSITLRVASPNYSSSSSYFLILQHKYLKIIVKTISEIKVPK